MKNRFDAFPSNPIADMEAVEANERFARQVRRERLRKFATAAIGSVAITSAVVFQQTQRDIQLGKSEVADSHSSMHLIYETNDPKLEGIATIVATGLGTRNPSETAQILSSHQQMGDVYALEYSNKDINVEELTETVTQAVERNDIDTLVFDGYSAGGPIELAIAANIHKDNPDINVGAVILNSSPVGRRSITPDSQRVGDMLSSIINIYPDIVYSEKWRAFVELSARHERYIDVDSRSFSFDSLRREAAEIYRTKIANEEAASASLIASQYNFIETYGVEQSLEILSESYHDKTEPTIFYTRSKDATSDSVVNVDKSRDNFVALTNKYDLESQVLYINAGHANPGERPDEYNAMFLSKIQPRIERQLQHKESEPVVVAQADPKAPTPRN